MTEHRAEPVGKYGSHPSSLLPQLPLSDRINTAMKGVEALELEAVIDRVMAQAFSRQLPSSNHPVLPLRKPGDRLVVTNPTFAAYIPVNVGFVAHGPSVAGLGRRVGNECYVWARFRSQISFRPVRVSRSSTSSTWSHEGTIAAA